VSPATGERKPESIPTPATGDRALSPYALREKVGRLLWGYLGQTMFRCTFHNWYRVRSAILRLFGADVGPHVRLRPTVKIEQPWNLTIGENSSIGDRCIVYCLGKIRIGSNVSISQGTHLCAGTHDYTRHDLPLLRPPIVIEDEVWLAADVFVGPGVTVHEGSVVGARSCVVKDLPAWSVCAGYPARAFKPRVMEGGR